MYMHFLTLLLVKKTSDSLVDIFKDSFINIDGNAKEFKMESTRGSSNKWTKT